MPTSKRQVDQLISTLSGTVNKLQSTGVISGTGAAINGVDSAKFDLQIVGQVVDPITFVVYSVSVNTTSQTVANLATQSSTFIGINQAGLIIQQATPFTTAQRYSLIGEWELVHTGNTEIESINSYPNYCRNLAEQLHSFMNSIGGINVSGNVFAPNGANVKLDKSEGIIQKLGVGNQTVNSANEITLASDTQVLFTIINQSGIETAILTNVDTTNYDLNGVTTALPGSAIDDYWQTYRIYVYGDNAVKLLRGQYVYTSMREAQASINTESYVIEPGIAANGILRGYLIVRKGTTDLSDTTKALFIEADKLGLGPIYGIVPTLQTSYDVSSSPIMEVNDIRGAFAVKNARSSNSSNIQEWKNLTGTTTAFIKGDGSFSAFTAAIGLSVPSASLHVKGAGSTSATYGLKVENSSSNSTFYVRNDGYISAYAPAGIHLEAQDALTFLGSTGGYSTKIHLIGYLSTLKINDGRPFTISGQNSGTSGESVSYHDYTIGSIAGTFNYGQVLHITNDTSHGVRANTIVGLLIEKDAASSVSNPSLIFSSLMLPDGGVTIGYDKTTNPTAQLQVKGLGATSATYTLKIENSTNTSSLTMRDDGVTTLTGVLNFPLLTSSRVPYIDGSNNLVVSSVTSTELGYLSGVTSNIQNQINNINSGLSWKAAARVMSNSDVTISAPGSSIDGITMTSGDRVVLKAQSTGSQNGVYVWNGSAVPMTRATDCSTGGTGSTGILGMALIIEEGTYADQMWLLSTDAPITIGSTTLTYIKSGGTTYTASNGVTLTGNNFTLDNSYFSGDVTVSGGVTSIGASKVLYSMIASMTSAQFAGIISDETGSGSLVFATSPTLVTPTLGVASATSVLLSGTAGNGYLELGSQSSAPSTPGSGSLKLYSDASGRLSWISVLGYSRTFRSSALTGNRLYTLQDRDGTLADDTDLALKVDKTNSVLLSYLEIPEQSAPSTPTNAIRLFTDTSNRLAWKTENGFVITLNATGNSADRIYAMPNANGTLALISDITGTNSGTNTGDETAARIATINHATTYKATLVSADELTGQNSASSYSLIRTTMADVYAYTAKQYENKTNGGNAAYSILAADNVIYTGTALTAARIWTLPLAASVNPGHEKMVHDFLQTITTSNTITIAVQSGEYLNGVLNGTEVMSAAGGQRKLISDGVNGWYTDLGVVRLMSIQTLTNKTIKKRILTVTQSATPSTNIDDADIVSITGLAQAITSMTTNLTGTPYEGQMILWQITDNGTARAITWGASFASTSSGTLPTTTVISTMTRVLTQYNSITLKHECLTTS